MTIRTGTWINDGGSVLELDVSNGMVSGQYCPAGGQPDGTEKFPLTGMVNGDLIGFVVSWGKYHSMTSWSGRYDTENGRECIRTIWHLARKYADYAHTVENEVWETFRSFTCTYYLEEAGA